MSNPNAGRLYNSGSAGYQQFPTPTIDRTKFSANRYGEIQGSVSASFGVTYDASNGIFIGGAGKLYATLSDGSIGHFDGIAAGTFLPLSVTNVSGSSTVTKVSLLY